MATPCTYNVDTSNTICDYVDAYLNHIGNGTCSHGFLCSNFLLYKSDVLAHMEACHKDEITTSKTAPKPSTPPMPLTPPASPLLQSSVPPASSVPLTPPASPLLQSSVPPASSVPLTPPASPLLQSSVPLTPPASPLLQSSVPLTPPPPPASSAPPPPSAHPPPPASPVVQAKASTSTIQVFRAPKQPFITHYTSIITSKSAPTENQIKTELTNIDIRSGCSWMRKLTTPFIDVDNSVFYVVACGKKCYEMPSKPSNKPSKKSSKESPHSPTMSRFCENHIAEARAINQKRHQDAEAASTAVQLQSSNNLTNGIYPQDTFTVSQ